MKANTPERIWIDPATDLQKLSGHIDKDSVEYIKKNAFIEKACSWLQDCINNGMWIANDVGSAEKEAIIESFKEYMK